MANHLAFPNSPRASLALQALALILLTAGLIPLLSGTKGLILLAAPVAGIGALWMIQRPHWGVLLILATWFVKIDVVGIRFLSIPYLVSAVLLIPLALAILRDRGSWVFRVPQVKILLTIGFLFLLSTWWNDFKYPITLFPAADETIRRIQLFVTRLAFLVFFVYFMRSRQKIEFSVWLILGLIAVAAISSLLQQGGLTKRAAAAFSLAENANRLAYISLFGTSLLWFYRSHAQRPRWNSLTLPLLVILTLTALATGSRSGFLQLVVLLALIVKEQEGWSATKRLRTFVFLGCMGILSLVVIPTAQVTRMTTFDPTVATRGQKSLQDRISKLLAAAEMIASDPFLGVGIGNFRWVGKAYYGNYGSPHNSYLRALGTGGIGVLALYLLLFYVTYRMLRKLERAGPPELLWLIKGLRVNLVLFIIFSAFADFWLSDFLYLIIGLTITLTCLGQDKVKNLVSVPLTPAPKLL